MKKKPRSRSKGRLVHIIIPEALHRQVRIRCAYEDRSIQDYVATLIAKDMQRFRVPGEGKGRRRK